MNTYFSQSFVVIKIGSSLVTEEGKINQTLFLHLATQIRELVEANIGVCLVASGAVSLGVRLQDSCSLSLSAGMGQALLSGELFSLFREQGLLLAQLLLTKRDFLYKRQRQHLFDLFAEGARSGIVFLVNENDSVELHSFGGNDFLASRIACLMKASYLLFLTDVEGVYDNDMQVIKEFHGSDQAVSLSTSFLKKSVGGIESKIQAAVETAGVGVETFIASGKKKGMIRNIVLENRHLGTRFI